MSIVSNPGGAPLPNQVALPRNTVDLPRMDGITPAAHIATEPAKRQGMLPPLLAPINTDVLGTSSAPGSPGYPLGSPITPSDIAASATPHLDAP